LELHSLDNYNNLITFLQEAEYVADDEFAIPIGFKYNTRDPYAMFHSFNNENSTPLDDPLKFMIDTDDLMKGMPGRTIVDALVIT